MSLNIIQITFYLFKNICYASAIITRIDSFAWKHEAIENMPPENILELINISDLILNSNHDTLPYKDNFAR